MSDELSRSKLQQARLLSQQLVTRSGVEPAGLVARLGAVQAQEKHSAIQAIRPRCASVTAQGVEESLHVSRKLIRTWCLRGTLHLVAAEDVGWMLALVAPRLLKNRERRYRQLELDADTLELATGYLTGLLEEHGALTRPEIAAYLERRGVSAEGQRMPHILGRAALLGLICHGPARDDGTETYVLMESWLEGGLQDTAGDWTALARRYLSGYGPASPEDFSAWSGATITDAREAFEALRPVEVNADGETLWVLEEQTVLRSQKAEPSVHLIPAYDPYLLGYRSRDWMVRAEFARQIHPGGGLLRPTVLVDGEAAGTWRLERQKRGARVTVSLFEDANSDLARLIETEAHDLSRYLNTAIELLILANGQN